MACFCLSTGLWDLLGCKPWLIKMSAQYEIENPLSRALYCYIDLTPFKSLQWRHNGRDGVSNHQPHDCLLNRLFRHRSKKTSKLRVTGLFAGNSPVTGKFPAQKASNAENISIWWHHHVLSASGSATFNETSALIGSKSCGSVVSQYQFMVRSADASTRPRRRRIVFFPN